MTVKRISEEEVKHRIDEMLGLLESHVDVTMTTANNNLIENVPFELWPSAMLRVANEMVTIAAFIMAKQGNIEADDIWNTQVGREDENTMKVLHCVLDAWREHQDSHSREIAVTANLRKVGIDVRDYARQGVVN